MLQFQAKCEQTSGLQMWKSSRFLCKKMKKIFRFMKYLKIVLKEMFIYVIITTEKLQ